MTQYQVDLHDFFSDEVARALKTFCHRINNSDADVFIIMAHKAVLLFYLLLAQGHISKQAAEKIIISNLALNFDCNYLEGKKIAILDDIVISGTTIASAVSKLMSVGVRQDDIDIIAIAIDQDYFNMNFENTKGDSILHCDFTLKDAPCIELSAVISKIFSYYGIPYDVDFPIYEQISVSEMALSSLHNKIFWDVVDVSNGNQQNGNVKVYTLFPSHLVLERLWNTIGTDLNHCADFKLRLYIKRYPDGTRECCIVPMCLFKEISQDALSALYNRLKPSSRPLFMTQETPWKAQMRYLEFCIAHYFFTIFSELTSLGRGIIFPENIAERLFGPIDGETVYQHLRKSHLQPGNALLTFPLAQIDYTETIEQFKQSDIYVNLCQVSANWGYGNDYQKSCWINQFIFSFFLWWYDTKEILTRNEVKKNRLHYVKDYQTIRHYLYRLENGLPLRTLCQMLQFLVPDIPIQEAERAISIFTDRAIDEGIIVPTIHYSKDEKYLCRAYRHGEDLPFGAADQYRLVYFMQSIGTYIKLAEECETPAVGAITLEKMIVLFYQMGLRKGNIFNRFLGFDGTEIIHSFLSVHGRVQGYTSPEINPHIYSEKGGGGEKYIIWLSFWLYEKGLLGKRPSLSEHADKAGLLIPIRLDKIKQYLESNQRSAATDEVLRNIESIAELIAIWYNNAAGTQRKEFKDDITALTSCSTRYVYASAIATEIHYFKNYWEHQAKHAFQKPDDGRTLVMRLKDSRENTQYTSNIIQGLHSGRDKIQWRYSGRAQAVISLVWKYLGSTRTVVWDKLWKCADKEDIEDNISKPGRLTKMAEAFLYFYSACFDCLNSTDFWDFGNLPQSYDSYEKSYLERARQISTLDACLFESLRSKVCQKTISLAEKAKQLDMLVRGALESSEALVDGIEEWVQADDLTYTVRYTSALILDIDALDSSQVELALMRFWEQLPEDEAKTELNIIRFPQNEEITGCSFKKYGIFCGTTSEKPLDTDSMHNFEDEVSRRGEYLYSAFQTVCSLLNGRLRQIRAILIPHIAPGFNFCHNLQRNINKNADDFYQRVVKPLERRYDNRWKIQLVLGLDHYVDEGFIVSFKDWQQKNLTSPADAKWITKCVALWKEFIKIEAPTDMMERVVYSRLKVSCGRTQGLGFLMRLSDRVVCVSCNHIFTEYSEKDGASAVSSYDPEIKFSLRPLTSTRPYPKQSLENIQLLPARKEVILLEPCWKENIPFVLCELVSSEDWDMPEVNAKCKLCGCDNAGELKWVSSIHVAGPSSKGYYQVDEDRDTTGSPLSEIQEGASGGVYVSTEPSAKIIGIHEGRFDEGQKVRMIPWKAVLDAIENLEKESRRKERSRNS